VNGLGLRHLHVLSGLALVLAGNTGGAATPGWWLYGQVVLGVGFIVSGTWPRHTQH
jgi:hypothetical protein